MQELCTASPSASIEKSITGKHVEVLEKTKRKAVRI